MGDCSDRHNRNEWKWELKSSIVIIIELLQLLLVAPTACWLILICQLMIDFDCTCNKRHHWRLRWSHCLVLKYAHCVTRDLNWQQTVISRLSIWMACGCTAIADHLAVRLPLSSCVNCSSLYVAGDAVSLLCEATCSFNITSRTRARTCFLCCPWQSAALLL